MKKNHFCFLASIVLALVLSSCMTITKSVNAPVETGDITIEVKKIIQEKGLGWWTMGIPITTTKTKGLQVVITNNTDKPQSINWNQSSINWLNYSSPVFLSGMKYSQAGQGTIPNTALGAGKSVTIDVYPANNVEWTGKTWKIDGIKLKKGDELSLIAFTESGIQIETSFVASKNDGMHFIW